MNIIYKTPKITIEVLEKKDVLCASGEIEPKDNISISGDKGSARNLFDLYNIL